MNLHRTRALLMATLASVLTMIAIWQDWPKPPQGEPTLPELNGSQKTGPIRRVLGEKIPLNAATAFDLTVLPGIGTGRARDILTYRLVHGPFTSIADLQRVPGIGPVTFKKIRPFLILDDKGIN